MEVVCSEDDHVWIQDYHLMLLPTFLRKRFNSIRCMFFLHAVSFFGDFQDVAE